MAHVTAGTPSASTGTPGCRAGMPDAPARTSYSPCCRVRKRQPSLRRRTRNTATACRPETPYCPETAACRDRKSTRLNSSHVAISYAVFCLKKKKKQRKVKRSKKKKTKTKKN